MPVRGSLKDSGKSVSKRNWYSLRALCLCLLAFFAVTAGGHFLLISWFYPGYIPIAFEQETWATSDAQHRGYMAESLLANHSLVGMSRGQIIELLGRPDVARDGDSYFRYNLGHMDRNPNAPFQLKLYLFISFGADGKAKHAGVAD
ncbi:MAG: hypothetical protein U0872_11745 [Planctomycetaceae bacterium]